ncbi:LacI family DNA-binding transcriptional regulator [Algisphaera agarilytica]|uniref:LacI family transcriptional regulator n=1 Tax=Algisphaera agarilytica TaxID=1385975 RepID=A0A7X0H4Z0_9BACT|nr:LacI family DNA-binding transcriptional regulator [Algisphaera agarilytica]MBB6429112.1 LacI family transcriptional regulator [Algisphaera agarilytica]
MTRTTIDQIAKQAGVSAGTVSRILNGKNKENRPAIAARSARIRQLAAELGYRPNAAARSMSRGRFGVMTFVTCGEMGFDWFSRRLLWGVHRQLEDQGESLVVSELDADKFSDPEFVPRLFQESATDGIVLNHDPKLDDQVVGFFMSQPVPGVLVNRKSDTNSIYPDEIGGARAATNHLLQQGRKHIGYFRLTCDDGNESHYSVSDRYQGYLDAMRDAGLPSNRCVLGDQRFRQGQDINGVDQAEAYLNLYPDVNGVVCYELADAVALYAAAMRKNLSIPDEFRIIVFADSLAYTTVNLPIDTILIPFDAVGMAAVEMVRAIGDESSMHPPSKSIAYQQLFDAKTRHVESI